jgi:hypothetical protein
MLADLHETRLVITPGYIGRDRRRTTTSRWGLRHQPISRLALVVMVALITSAIVVPLTLALAPQGVSATATDPARAHAPGPGADLAAAPRARKVRPPHSVRSHAAGSATRVKPSTSCDQSAGPAASPRCLRRQQTSQRQDARSAQRASRSEQRSAVKAERAAAQASRSAARAARVAARQSAGTPAP